jgi:hypothetical protein
LAIDLQEMVKSLPPEAAPALQEAGYFEPDRLEAGMRAPTLALAARDGGRLVEIGGAAGDRPVVLIFGSYT